MWSLTRKKVEKDTDIPTRVALDDAIAEVASRPKFRDHALQVISLKGILYQARILTDADTHEGLGEVRESKGKLVEVFSQPYRSMSEAQRDLDTALLDMAQKTREILREAKAQ